MLGYELYDMIVWLDEGKSDASAGIYQYDLPVLNLNSAKNNGYAFQWFAMSLALLIIYLVVNTKNIKVK
jgi:cytochrome oxidase assembly protein ShyY1